MIRQDILNICRLKPGNKVRLKDHDTGWAQTKELKELGKDVVKERASEILEVTDLHYFFAGCNFARSAASFLRYSSASSFLPVVPRIRPGGWEERSS